MSKSISPEEYEQWGMFIDSPSVIKRGSKEEKIIMQEYSIENTDDGRLVITAFDQLWTKRIIRDIRDRYGIYYDGGVFAVQRIERKNAPPMLLIGREDDGTIIFNKHEGFVATWAADLVSVITEAIVGRGDTIG